jgi:hypothetical protein
MMQSWLDAAEGTRLVQPQPFIQQNDSCAHADHVSCQQRPVNDSSLVPQNLLQDNERFIGEPLIEICVKIDLLSRQLIWKGPNLN